MNPTFDALQSTSAKDEFDVDMANADFGCLKEKTNVAELNNHGISFNKDFINPAKVARPTILDKKSLDELPSQFYCTTNPVIYRHCHYIQTWTPHFVFFSKVLWDTILTNKIPPLKGNS
jgi:hypothetical protein